jgi:hypothetical protein
MGDAAAGLTAVRPGLGNLHRQPLGGLEVESGPDERDE